MLFPMRLAGETSFLDVNDKNMLMFEAGSLEALRMDIEAISHSYPEEYEELVSMVDQLSGMVSAGTVTSRETESVVGTLYHALHHIKTYASVDAALSAAKVRANALAEETGKLSATPSTFHPWGKPTVYDPQNPIMHITATIVDQPHTMMDKNHPYTRYRMIFKSESPANKRYYMVYRRFNDVKRLNTALVDLKIGSLPALPPQRSVFQSLYDPLFIEDRRKRLADYLQLLSSMLSVVQTEAFQHFLTEDGQYRAIEEGYT